MSLGGIVLTTFASILMIMGALKFYNMVRKRKRMLKLLQEFDGPPGHWLVGHIKYFTQDEGMMQQFREWLEIYGPISKYRTIMYKTVVLAEPESIATVLKTTEPKDYMIYSRLAQWIGNGLITSDGAHWFRNRRLLTPAFHFEILKPYTEIFNQTAHTLISKWMDLCGGKEVSLEMFKHLSLMTLDGMLQTAFSTTTHCQTTSTQHSYTQAVQRIERGLMIRYRILLLHLNFVFYYLTKIGKRTKKAMEQAKSFTQGIIRERQQEKTKMQGNTKRKYMDFIDMLLEAKDEDGVGLSEQEILDEVDTFMFAGHDTTSSGLAWFLYNLAQHPDHQQRCREEVLDILGDRTDIAWSDLNKLEFLTMCLKESLRLHGPVPLISRQLSQDIQLPDGRVVPAGACVWLFLYLLHHNPAVWDNPEEFDPYRFSKENSEVRHSHAYVPFSAGPRNCIGQQFAMYEMKIASAQILRHFYVGIEPEKPPKRLINIVLQSKNGVWLRLRPLSASKGT